MSITKLMTHRAEHCTPDTDLAAAAMIMWRTDCGMVPVVELDSGHLGGVITDRDICMAAATKHQPACCIPVGDVMNRDVVKCRHSDSAQTALARMAEHRVRRLPVVDDEGRLIGVLSIADLIRAAAGSGGEHAAAVAPGDVLTVLQSICRPQGAADESMAPRTRARRRKSASAAAGARSVEAK